jgi:hypothetical protein
MSESAIKKTIRIKTPRKKPVPVTVQAAPIIALYEEPVQAPTSSNKKTRRTPCPKGYIRNKKTGLCEKNTRKSQSTVRASKNVISQTPLINEQQTVFIQPPPLINEQQTVFNEPSTLVIEQQTVINEQNNGPCIEDLKKLRTELKDKTKAVVEKNKECEKILYGNFVQQYFAKIDDKNLTHKLLLKGLFNFYKTEKDKNKDFTLLFGGENEDFNKRGFIQRFPRDNALQNTNFKRQHIFEALCRLLLLFNYDEGELGNNKTFYGSLEGLLGGNSNIQSTDDILDTKVNESSKGGIVDILFKTNISVDKKKREKMSACEYTAIIETNTLIEPAQEESTILIQNKFFDVEKTNIDKYDVTRIHTLAGKLKTEQNSTNNRIILMINNQEALSSNLIKSKQQFRDIMPDENIFGVAKIDKWFNKMLYDMYNSTSFDEFLGKKKVKQDIKGVTTLEPRFHQLLITNSTLEYNKGGIQKFIWGAVPRSGKSFMIGDFISKRKKETTNDIVIILGAKTETEPQFIKMFNDYDNFSDYAVITPDKQYNSTGKRKIYIFSQEWFKSVGKINLGVKIPKNVKNLTSEMKKNIRKHVRFETKVYSLFPDLLREGKHIDIFFDEIHKGGSTDNSEMILYSFLKAKLEIDFFIMVTATFAKPTEFYSELNIGNNTIQLIEWSYSDQQFMKEVVNETKKQEMINSRTNVVEKKIMEELFEDYHVRYGISYLQVLSSEYTKYPELVLISPQLMNEDTKLFETNDVRNVFIGNLKCEACIPGQSIEHYQMPSNIFKQETPVTELLDYIGDKIYNSFLIDFRYNISSSHTQLWFLPDSDLYQEDCDVCKTVSEERNEEEDEYVESEDVEAGEEAGEDVEAGEEAGEAAGEELSNKSNSKKNKANIEPLTRGLAIKIIKHERFTRYNVFIVHNTSLTNLGSRINEITLFGESFNGRIKMYNPSLAAANKRSDSLSLAEQIRLFERKTYKEGKSLIILTGAKLRLGISLPCVDIGFNFDNIKSIDNNYQTMFRVLTEREKPIMKKYGYYVDFNMGRSIEFLYQYATVYGDKQNKKSTPEKIEYLQSLLFSFNFNGLNLITGSSTNIGMYNDLKDKMSLTKEKYVSYWSKNENLSNLIKKGLAASDQAQLKELAQLLKITAAKKPSKLNVVIQKGKARHALEQIKLQTKSVLYIENYKKGEAIGYSDETNTGKNDGYYNQRSRKYKKNKPLTGNDSEDGYNKGFEDGYNKRYDELYAEGVKEREDENSTEEIYNDDLIEQLAQEIPTIVTLLALFSNERGYECDSINDCLDSTMKQIESFSKLCQCGTVKESNIVDCFMNSPGNINGVGLAEPLAEGEEDVEEEADFLEGGGAETLYDKRTLIKILNIIKQQIENSPLIDDSLEIKFSTIIQKMKGAKDTLIKTMTPEEIDKFITNNLTIKKTEKDKFGEVFTPPLLITEMLSKIPPEVWTNPDLKWLDPANGIGNFPMLVYEKLLEKLKPKIPNDTERSNHILSKMLYMVEINPKNVKISRKIFGPTANIACADFLNETENWKKEFKGVDKFDVILGNPPFQIEQEGKREGGYGGRTLWDKFIIKCLNESLNNNGFLGFINPPPWRKPTLNNGDEENDIETKKSVKKKKGEKIILWNLMTQQNQLLYLHIFNKIQGQQLFHVSQRVDLYIIEKKTPYTKTEIIDEIGNKLIGDKAIDLKQWGFLPNYAFENIKKIMTTEENGIKVLYSSTIYETRQPYICDKQQDAKCIIKNPKGKIVRESPKQNFQYPVVHSITQNGFEKYKWYSSEIKKDKNGHSHFGEPKVLLNFNENQYPVNDYEGKYGMSQITFGIPIKSKKEGDDIVKAINSAEFKTIIKATKWGAFQTDWRMFKYFKPDFYKSFLKDDKTSSPKLSKEPSPPKPPSPPKAATKKKVPVKKSGRKLSIKESTKPKGGSKKNKTKKQRRVKLPQKTRRKY